jgi:hypothetical protein
MPKPTLHSFRKRHYDSGGETDIEINGPELEKPEVNKIYMNPYKCAQFFFFFFGSTRV